MSKKKVKTLDVFVGNLKTRNNWGAVKPYTRIQTPKTAYRRKGRRVNEI